MKTIQVTARLTIHDGKLKEFKQLATQCMQLVREREPGALQYDWFFDAKETVCVVREAYEDSDAVLAHVANLGATLGSLLELCDSTLELFGSASPELLAATKGLGALHYAPFQSL